LFHLRRKSRHRPYQLIAVYAEHDFFEYWKCNPAAGFLSAEGQVVVAAYTNGDGASFGAISRANKERISELVRRPCLTHDRDRENAGAECMSRAGRNSHDAAQSFLSTRCRVIAR